jgi:hypothetical protein
MNTNAKDAIRNSIFKTNKNMKRIVLFLGTIALVSVITMHLQAEYNKEHPQPPKLYPVNLSLEEWQLKINYLEYVKQILRKSDLPSKEVALVTDSALTPFQTQITQQIQSQLAQEKSAQQKKDTTKLKKN